MDVPDGTLITGPSRGNQAEKQRASPTVPCGDERETTFAAAPPTSAVVKRSVIGSSRSTPAGTATAANDPMDASNPLAQSDEVVPNPAFANVSAIWE